MLTKYHLYDFPIELSPECGRLEVWFAALPYKRWLIVCSLGSLHREGHISNIVRRTICWHESRVPHPGSLSSAFLYLLSHPIEPWQQIIYSFMWQIIIQNTSLFSNNYICRKLLCFTLILQNFQFVCNHQEIELSSILGVEMAKLKSSQEMTWAPHVFEIRLMNITYFVGEHSSFGSDVDRLVSPESGKGVEQGRHWEQAIRQALMPVTPTASLSVVGGKLDCSDNIFFIQFGCWVFCQIRTLPELKHSLIDLFYLVLSWWWACLF